MKQSNIAIVVASFLLLVLAIGVAVFVHDQTKTTPISSAPAPNVNASSTGSQTTTQGSATTQQPAQQSTAPTCISPSQAANDEGNGQSECVQFTGYAYTSDSGQMYLDQSTSAPYGFSVWIPAGTSGGSSIINQYSGQSIDVTGSIVNYNGEPEIEVTSASQITVAQ